MTWIGWNNSEKHSSGAGYGFKIDRAERNRNFKPEWQQITVELLTPRGISAVSVNVSKSSFWKNCGYSGEIDHHSALKPITIPVESDQASERSDAGFSIFPEGDRFRQV